MNTKDILIAERYADALVQIAREGKLTFEKISSDFSLIKEILKNSSDLDEFLTNPVVSIEKKKEIIDSVFQSEVDILVVNFLKVLIDKGRFSIFNEVLDAYNVALDSINNLSRVKVTSAVEMSTEAKDKLKIKLEEKLKKNVVFDLAVNADIIAGLVIQVGDNVIDMSLKHKLEDLSKNIMR